MKDYNKTDSVFTPEIFVKTPSPTPRPRHGALSVWLLCAFGMLFTLILRIPSTSPTLLPYIRWRSVGEV